MATVWAACHEPSQWRLSPATAGLQCSLFAALERFKARLLRRQEEGIKRQLEFLAGTAGSDCSSHQALLSKVRTCRLHWTPLPGSPNPASLPLLFSWNAGFSPHHRPCVPAGRSVVAIAVVAWLAGTHSSMFVPQLVAAAWAYACCSSRRATSAPHGWTHPCLGFELHAGAGGSRTANGGGQGEGAGAQGRCHSAGPARCAGGMVGHGQRCAYNAQGPWFACACTCASTGRKPRQCVNMHAIQAPRVRLPAASVAGEDRGHLSRIRAAIIKGSRSLADDA